MGKYEAEKAFELFNVADKYGLGKTIDQLTPTNRRVKKFRKTPYDLLSADARSVLREIRITEDEYRSSFIAAPGKDSDNGRVHVSEGDIDKENVTPPTVPAELE